MIEMGNGRTLAMGLRCAKGISAGLAPSPAFPSSSGPPARQGRSTLETVASFRLNTARAPLRVDPFGRDPLDRQEPAEAGDAFLGWVTAWVILTAVLNEVSRSMGQPDLYPFVLNGPVVRKLPFVLCVIHGRQAVKTEPPPASLAAPTIPPPES